MRDSFKIVWEYTKKEQTDLKLDAPKETRKRKFHLNIMTIQLSPLHLHLKINIIKYIKK